MKRLITIKRSNLISTIFEHEKDGISWKSTRKSVDIIVQQVLKILLGLSIYSFGVYLTIGV